MSDGATRSERKLWEHYAAGSPGMSRAAEPGPETLAAWLDGRLAEDEAGPVEAWLATSPEAAAFVAALRADPEGVQAPAPPTALVARAQRLVHAEAARGDRRTPSLLARLFSPAMGAAFAAMLLAAAGGFELGARTFVDMEQVDAEVAAEMWLVGEATEAFPES